MVYSTDCTVHGVRIVLDMVECFPLADMGLMHQQHNDQMLALQQQQQQKQQQSSRIQFTPFFIENILQEKNTLKCSSGHVNNIIHRDSHPHHRSRSRDSVRQREEEEEDEEYRGETAPAGVREEPLDLCKNQSRRRVEEVGIDGARKGPK